MIVAKLRAEDDGRSDPVIPRDHVFGVLRGKSGSLPPDVIEIFVPDRDIVLRVDLIVEISQRCPLGREARQFGGVIAIRTVGVINQQRRGRRISYVGRVFHVLIPGFPGDMPPGLPELVIEGRVVSREVVVVVLS